VPARTVTVSKNKLMIHFIIALQKDAKNTRVFQFFFERLKT